MVEADVPIHAVPVVGGYFEVDTTEDYQLAREGWA